MLTYKTGVGRSKAGARSMAAYLSEQSIPRDAADLSRYYTDMKQPAVEGDKRHEAATAAEPRRDIAPRLARLLGIDTGRSLTREELANLLNGQRTDGEEIEGRRAPAEGRTRISFVDFTLSPDKSFDVAWAFAPTEAERAILLQCHREAVDRTMAHIADVLGEARRGDAGRLGVEKGSLAWVKFDHFTSRPAAEIATTDKEGKAYTEIQTVPRVVADPKVHTHGIMLNAILTNSGHVGSMDLNTLRGNVHMWGGLYQATLATLLREHGVNVGLGKDGQAQLLDVPETARNEFSKRSQDATAAAQAFAADHAMDWDALDGPAKVKLLRSGATVTRNAKEGDVEWEAWRRQAEAIGYQHRSVLRPDERTILGDGRAHLDIALPIALDHLEDSLERRAVLTAADPRLAAVRSMVVSGTKGPEDINRLTAAMREHGVRQDGELTELVWTEGGPEEVRISTALHEAKETELVALVKAAHADRRLALTSEQIAAGVAKHPHLNFESDHGKGQRGGIERLGTGGRFEVFIGAAGAGKTSLLAPLVSAWRAEGLNVFGVALGWKQTDTLENAGIAADHRAALSVFLAAASGEELKGPRGRYRSKTRKGRVGNYSTAFSKAMNAGEVTLNRHSVVVLDELSLVGTQDLLTLARLQRDRGFKIVAVGDDAQCQSVAAGPVIQILQDGLGKNQIPELLTTVRQKTDREKEIVGLLRQGKVAEALQMKEEDGTLHRVTGDRRAVIKAVAKLRQERIAQNRDRADYSISISAPTNADARDISEAVRKLRMEAGDVQPTRARMRAVDRAGETFELALSVGDHVRLLANTVARFGDGTSGNIGRNQSVLQIRDVSDEGLTVRNRHGRVGLVKWTTLQEPEGARIRLELGYASTIDSSQSLTVIDEIQAMPSGSAAVNLFKGYTAGTRHERTNDMVLSDGAERREVLSRRSLGDHHQPVSDKEVLDNVARNLARAPEKLSTLRMIAQASVLHRGFAHGFSGRLEPVERNRSQGREISGQEQQFAERARNLGRHLRTLVKELVAGRGDAEREGLER